ncbi:beta strand repeat-containing protein [Nocardioides sp.]|uniref:beta strand repeat-containing protein n=1 Tax=Nocardioides sp. TaxID=35761 RepID=UPI0039E4A557
MTVEDGGILTAPSGYLINLSVNGVDTGSVYDAWPQVTQSIVAGTYTGAVVLTPTLSHTMTDGFTFPIRQALYVDANGINEDYSVTADLNGTTTQTDTQTDNLRLTSTGDGQNGVWVEGGTYTLNKPTITMTGRGRSDFVGAGSGAIVANSADVTVDGATINNNGTVRTALISQGTESNLVVKNSTIYAGPSPEDETGSRMPANYISSSATQYMEGTPWKLGVVGSNRATNLIGQQSKASYINSSITSYDWGALSTDSGSYNTLTTINSEVDAGATSGSNSGYGTWAIGNATENLLGTTIAAGSYGSVITHNGSATVHWGDSDADTVAALNTDLSLGLTADELAALPEQATSVTARKSAAAFNSEGNLLIDGATTVESGDATFLDRADSSLNTITIDGSEGASFDSDTGVFFQTITNDNTGGGTKQTLTVNGTTYSITDNLGASVESTVTPNSSWNLSDASASSRSELDLTDTSIDGDLFNGARIGKNLVVNLDGTTVRGLITSTTYAHQKSSITSEDWDLISIVTNTVAAPVNNGVIVNLANDSKWIVPGTSYLTSLTGASADSIVGAGGKDVTVTIGGVAYSPADLDATTTYTGTVDSPIVVTVADGDIASTTSVSVADTAYGADATAEVSVVDADGYPVDGDVTVSVDGTEVGTATLDDGAASVDLGSDLDAGDHTVTVDYAGDTDDSIGASTGSTSFTVAQASSTTSLALSADSVTYGTAPTATVTVEAGSATPTGEVTLTVDGTEAGTATLTSGSATLTLAADLAVGSHTLTASYPGDSNVTGSTSNTATLTVTAASGGGGGQTTPVSSATKLKLGKHTIKKGKRVKATVTVTATGTTPTGTVTIYRGKKLLGSYTLDSNGALSVKLPKLAKKGTYKIRAVYAGDANVTGSTSNKAKLRVTKK